MTSLTLAADERDRLQDVLLRRCLGQQPLQTGVLGRQLFHALVALATWGQHERRGQLRRRSSRPVELNRLMDEAWALTPGVRGRAKRARWPGVSPHEEVLA